MQEEPFDIEINALIKVIIRRWYLFLIITLGCGFLLAYIKKDDRVTYYRASTRMIIGSNTSGTRVSYDIQDIKLYQNYINTYAAMIKTDQIIDKTVEALSFNVGGEAIKSSITVVPQENTQFFEITIYWGDSSQINEILTTLTDSFIREMAIIYPDISLHIMDKVHAPIQIVEGKSQKTYFLIGAVLGSIIAVLTIFGLEFLDHTVKADSDIERRLGIGVVGEIPYIKTLNPQILSENIATHHFIETFIEAFMKTLIKLEVLCTKNAVKVLSVTSFNALEGKTTVSIMLAVCMALNKKRVLIIDGDLKKPSLFKYLKVQQGTGLVNYLIGKEPIESLIHKECLPYLDFLSVGECKDKQIFNYSVLDEMMKVLRKHYDYIVVDTTYMEKGEAQILTHYIEATLLVAIPCKTPLKQLQKAKKEVESVGGKVIGLVLNKVKR